MSREYGLILENRMEIVNGGDTRHERREENGETRLARASLNRFRVSALSLLLGTVAGADSR